MDKKKNPSAKQKKNTRNKGHDNLRPAPLWKPGQSGNPAGRKPNEKMMSDVLRELLECKEVEMTVKANDKEINIHVKADRPLKYALCISQIAEGIKGNTKAFREIADRVEGRAVQNINSNMPITYLISEEFMPDK